MQYFMQPYNNLYSKLRKFFIKNIGKKANLWAVIPIDLKILYNKNFTYNGRRWHMNTWDSSRPNMICNMTKYYSIGQGAWNVLR